MIIASIPVISYVIGAITSVFALLLVAGLLAGQFRRGVVQELRDSLETANTEIGIERARADRLERTLQDNNVAIHRLEERIQRLEGENRILRETLQTGLKLAPEFKETMLDLLRVHEEKSQVMLEHMQNEIILRLPAPPNA